MMYSAIYGMITENTAKILLAKYRKRTRDIWTEEEKIAYNFVNMHLKKIIL